MFLPFLLEQEKEVTETEGKEYGQDRRRAKHRENYELLEKLQNSVRELIVDQRCEGKDQAHWKEPHRA